MICQSCLWTPRHDYTANEYDDDKSFGKVGARHRRLAVVTHHDSHQSTHIQHSTNTLTVRVLSICTKRRDSSPSYARMTTRGRAVPSPTNLAHKIRAIEWRRQLYPTKQPAHETLLIANATPTKNTLSTLRTAWRGKCCADDADGRFGRQQQRKQPNRRQRQMETKPRGERQEVANLY